MKTKKQIQEMIASLEHSVSDFSVRQYHERYKLLAQVVVLEWVLKE